MAERLIKIPGPDHPISIEANRSRVVVKVGGKIIADTSDALTLHEASYPPAQYIPRRDVDIAALTRSEHTTYCPYKGDASYHSSPVGGDRSINAVWTYETPFEAMAQIKDYVAFYPDRVDEIKTIYLGTRCALTTVLSRVLGDGRQKRKHCIFGIHNLNLVGHLGRALLQAGLNEHRRSAV
jgi:uncharacterized protein (DUF427 family)